MTWMMRIVVLAGLVVSAGCATTGKSVPRSMTLVSFSSMKDIHCTRISTSGIRQIIFEKNAVGGPVTRYLLDAVKKNGGTHYRVRIYASTNHEKPEMGIYYRQFPGKVAVMIELPDFATRRDALVIVDSQGEHQIAAQ